MAYHIILILDGFLESEFTRIYVMKNVTAVKVEDRFLNLKFDVKFSTYLPEFTLYILDHVFVMTFFVSFKDPTELTKNHDSIKQISKIFAELKFFGKLFYRALKNSSKNNTS